MPLQAEYKHVLIAASSPRVGGGAFTDLISIRDPVTNEPMVNSIVVGAPCEACLKTDKPWMCPHNSDSIATSKDPQKMERLIKIYDMCNMSSIIQGELLGELGVGLQVVFEPQLVRDLVGPYNMVQMQLARCEREPGLMTKELQAELAPPKVDAIIISIDPAGTGAHSEIATVVMGYTADVAKPFVILMIGAERLDGTSQHMRDYAVSILNMLHNIDEFRYTPIVVAVEAQSNDCLHYADWMKSTAKQLDMSLIVLAEHQTQGIMAYGVLKTHEISRLLVESTHLELSMKRVKIWPRVLALATSHVGRPKSAQTLVQELETEHRNYRYDLQTQKYSGKAAGPDDLMIAEMMCFLHMQRFCASEREDYADFKNQFPTNVWRTYVPEEVAARDVQDALNNMQCQPV